MKRFKFRKGVRGNPSNYLLYGVRRYSGKGFGVALVSELTGDVKEWISTGHTIINARRKADRLNAETARKKFEARRGNPNFSGWSDRENRYTSVSKRDIEQWVNNDESLYSWWKSEGGSLRAFISRNHSEIQNAILRQLNRGPRGNPSAWKNRGSKRFYGGGTGLNLSKGTWIESEEHAYPHGRMTRRGVAVHEHTGKKVRFVAGIPDTYFSIPARTLGSGAEKGFLTIQNQDDEQWILFTANKNSRPNPRRRRR